MRLTIINIDFLKTGIFGILDDEDSSFAVQTLQHAYLTPNGWAPKIPAGMYVCVRGQHKLPGMTEYFETFEVIGVPGHYGLLFHSGNINEDSNGCILLGFQREGNEIIESKAAFNAFMEFLIGIDEFELTVI